MQVNEDFSQLPKIKDIGRWYVTRFVDNVAKSLPPGSSVLDAGAGECAYKRFFIHCQYKAIDLGVGETSWNYGNLDYVGRSTICPSRAIHSTPFFAHRYWSTSNGREKA